MTAEQRAKVFKALSDPHRVAIVDSLAKNGAQCGTELSEQMGISIALVSHHWEVLVEAGLIRKERVGQARYCTLDVEKLHEVMGGWDDVVPMAEPGAAEPVAKPKAKGKAKARTRLARR